MCIHQLASHRPVPSLTLEDQTPGAWVTLHNDKSNGNWESKMFKRVSSNVERARGDPSPSALGADSEWKFKFCTELGLVRNLQDSQPVRHTIQFIREQSAVVFQEHPVLPPSPGQLHKSSPQGCLPDRRAQGDIQPKPRK